MNSEDLLLQEKDTSATTLGSPGVSSRWQKPIYYGPRLASDISTFTAPVFFPELVLEIMKPTSPLITVFPQEARALASELWVEIDVHFPPKKTRTITGRVVKRERAKFETAFLSDVCVEIEAPFPPKKTRTVTGRVVKRERAKFETAFGDELIESGG